MTVRNSTLQSRPPTRGNRTLLLIAAAAVIVVITLAVVINSERESARQGARERGEQLCHDLYDDRPGRLSDCLADLD